MAGEKTEQATPKRKKEARKEGQVARTQELGAWSAMMLAGLTMPMMVKHELEALRVIMVASLREISHPTLSGAKGLLLEGALHSGLAVALLGSCVLVVSVAATVAQGGFFLATKSAKPSFSKLSLIKGAKRIFGPHTLWEGTKMLVKCALVGLFAWSAMKAMVPLLGGMVPTDAILTVVSDHALGMMRSVAAVGVVMAGADYLMAHRRTNKQTKMSKDDVKQEHKQTEGDPLVKSHIRGRQLAAARNRMMAAVPEADVVLVNPTHVAVALRYQAEKGAPVVVALGAGAIATRIREIAEENRVPLVRDVPLARALYASTEVGREIPAELFAAVAQVLAFVISRRQSGIRGGQHRSPRRESGVPEIARRGRRRRVPVTA